MGKVNSITKGEYEEDLKNTRKELAAYRFLSHGYKTLSELPENKKGNAAKMFSIEHRKYKQLAQDCSKFLNTLEAYGEDNFSEGEL